MAGSLTTLRRHLPLVALGPLLLGACLNAWALAHQVDEPSTVTAQLAPAMSTTSPGPEPAASTLARSEPVHLRIPSIDGSPAPGEAGPSVIEGHVTSQGYPPSVFFELGALEVGDLAEVDREDGTTVTFEVYDAQAFPKDSFPKTTVYGNTQGPELRLITCGGVYDPQTGSHLDNMVLFARSTG